MPKETHDKLARQADKKGLTGSDRDAYVYGTMAKIEGNRQRKRQSTDSANTSSRGSYRGI